MFRTWPERVCLSVMTSVCVLGVGSIFYYLGFMAYWQLTVGRQLNEEFGFVTGTPYTKSQNSRDGYQEVLVIEKVEPGGLFARAGFRERDIVCGPVRDPVQFYRMLEKARGGEPIKLTVVPWDDEVPLEERPTREITLRLPPRPEPTGH